MVVWLDGAAASEKSATGAELITGVTLAVCVSAPLVPVIVTVNEPVEASRVTLPLEAISPLDLPAEVIPDLLPVHAAVPVVGPTEEQA